jgi:hypothetical protein
MKKAILFGLIFTFGLLQAQVPTTPVGLKNKKQQSTSLSDSKTQVPVTTFLPGVPKLDFRSFKLPAAHVVEEFIVSGTATSYKEVGDYSKNGQWNVQEANTAPYTTRMVVVRPADAKKFNGTVIVEWLNVTGGFDFSPARIMMWRELARNGSIWVGVSAQIVGVQGGPTLSGFSLPLKKMNAERYKQLSHPGDAFSFDIYSQVGRLLKGLNAPSLLGGIVPKHVISMGESQSGYFLATYINSIDPIAKVYDGYLDYSRFGFQARLDGVSFLDFKDLLSNTHKIRSDLRVPVLLFETETDVLGSYLDKTLIKGYYTSRVPDTDRLRVWEVTGTSHSDSYLYNVSEFDADSTSYELLAKAYAPTNSMHGTKIDNPFNNAPQHHYMVQAAIVALEKWVATGKAPAKASPIQVTALNIPGTIPTVVRDKNGNAKGGVRSPWVDVPTSILSGVSHSSQPGAMLAGSVEPFDAKTLDSLYPGGKAEYLKKFEKALRTQIKAGFILAVDKREILEIAKLSYKGIY